MKILKMRVQGCHSALCCMDVWEESPAPKKEEVRVRWRGVESEGCDAAPAGYCDQESWESVSENEFLVAVLNFQAKDSVRHRNAEAGFLFYLVS